MGWQPAEERVTKAEKVKADADKALVDAQAAADTATSDLEAAKTAVKHHSQGVGVRQCCCCS